MRKINRIEPKIPVLVRRKRVAAYARVSVESERLQHSLSAQVSYYSNFIQRNPEWEYAGVFADYGISGTGVKKRDAFKDMLQACEDGKIDIILTKSISRFARNTVDLLETVRRLKTMGIEVRFEKEHINSMSGDGELMLGILASFAQEESRSISDNTKWGIRKRYEKGITRRGSRIYGYRWKNDDMLIDQEEATVIKRIYQAYIDGKSLAEIERELAADGISTRAGKRWTDSNLTVVLKNVTYTGNLLLQKNFIEDPISKKRRVNKGQLPQYYVENTHPAIIDKDTFDRVQAEMARRKELCNITKNWLNITCFTRKIKCSECGCNYIRFSKPNKCKTSSNGDRRVHWVCNSKVKKGKHCNGHYIPEQVLRAACADAMGLDDFDETVFSDRVDSIKAYPNNALEFRFKDGSSKNITWEPLNKKLDRLGEDKKCHR